MQTLDPAVEKETTLQLVRQSIRSRNLRRLKEAMERPWAAKFIARAEAGNSPGPVYLIMHEALSPMRKEDRQKALQWTWDCYHPYMADLGKCLADLDGYSRPLS
jgi:hypothetical protein